MPGWLIAAAASLGMLLIGSARPALAEVAPASAPAVTPYGSRSPAAPAELDLFAFLIGKWEGTAKVRKPDGTMADGGKITWTGRWVLDGSAIADEGQATGPDGRPYFGVSLRRYDRQARAWTVEFINVTANFIRRQVNPRSGSVKRQGDTVVVEAADGDRVAREFYEVLSHDRFVYRIDLSKDHGKTWDTGAIEITMSRVE
jgi:hypothetical protein